MQNEYCATLFYPLRHHSEEQMAAEQNDADVDTVRYAKKRRYLEDSAHLKIRGKSCTDTEWMIVDLNILKSPMSRWIQLFQV